MTADSIAVLVRRTPLSDGTLIVHELFHSERPITLSKAYEYLLPAEHLLDEHIPLVDSWLAAFRHDDPEVTAQRYRAYLETAAQDHTLIDLLSRLRPHSLVFHRTKSWLLCKSQSQLCEPSTHGNMVLLPSVPSVVDVAKQRGEDLRGGRNKTLHNTPDNNHSNLSIRA